MARKTVGKASKLGPRRGAEDSEVRTAFLDAAAQILRKEGVSGLTSGRLAEKLDLKRQTVHYYFGTIEDLIIALLRRDGDKIRDRMMELSASSDPLRTIWDEAGRGAPLAYEFIALAVRSKPVRVEIKKYMQEFRRIEVRAIERHFELRGIKPATPVAAMAFLAQSIPQILAIERTLGLSDGHAETKALVEGWLQAFAQRGTLKS